jgi:hypothetical protein
MSNPPKSATLFAFNIGFGDCFLLRFQYTGSKRRHVLIDFGSTRQPKIRPSKYLTRVAEQIQELCGGKLDVVVATHRHKDHIGGFARNKAGTAPGDIIRSCSPTLVIQPWIEHPDAARDATKSPDQTEASRAFAGSIENMSALAGAAYRMAQQDEGTDPRHRLFTEVSELDAFSFLGENNIKNKSAVENLMSMGKTRRYLCFGDDPGTSDILPGVNVDVLGPPTLSQNAAISEQRAKNKEEYWHLQASSANLAVGLGAALFPRHAAAVVPGWARWGRERLRALRRHMLMSIVRELDEEMNNTSLILLFRVGDKSLLFPGDAQWENWSHALSKKKVQKTLESVDLYKVGHHGSLNATPKTMWRLFENRGPKSKKGRLVSVNSTMHGVHGHSANTAVPSHKLVNALEGESTHITTEEIPIKKTTTKFYKKIQIDFG